MSAVKEKETSAPATGLIFFLWSLVAVFYLSLLAAFGWAICAYHLRPQPPLPEAPGGERQTPCCGAGDDVAGSGSNLPLMRRLLEALEQQEGQKIRLHPSIGSRGAVRAVVDGAIGLGLISRPLKDVERVRGLVSLPYARTAVVLAAHPDVPLDSVSASELLQLYRGEKLYWSDGLPVTVFLREPGDSSQAALEKLAGFARAVQDAHRRRLWPVVFTDREMLRALQDTPGSIGLTDLGQVRLEAPALKVIDLDGHRPGRESLENGSYPYDKELAFIFFVPLSPPAERLVQLTFSASGRQALLAADYLPLGAGR